MKINIGNEVYENDKEEYSLNEIVRIVTQLKKKDLNKKIKLMRCPKCKSINVKKRGFRYNLFSDIQKYACLDCKYIFSINNNFRMKYPKRVLDFAKREKGSLAQIKEKINKKFHVVVSRTTIMHWRKPSLVL